MPSAAHTVQEELKGILAFIGVIWAVFFVSLFFARINQFGLQPRSLTGLIGVATMPFLHQGWGHIISNTTALIVLLGLLAGSRARSWEIVAEIIVVGGVLLWLAGRGSAVHIGASGLVFGLIAFLILGGVFEGRVIPLLVAALTFFLFGGTLVWGVLPTNPQISWDGHLCGAVAGGLLAFRLARKPKADERE